MRTVLYSSSKKDIQIMMLPVFAPEAYAFGYHSNSFDYL